MTSEHTEPDSLVIAIKRGEQWLTWKSNRYITRIPLRFSDLLGILKKLQANSYYIAGHVKISEHSLEEIRNPRTWLPEAGEVMKIEVVEQTNAGYYAVLFRLDKDYITEHFSQEMAAPP